MTNAKRNRLIAASANVVRLDDHRPPPERYQAPLSDFDIRLEAIARMFMAERAAERAGASSRARAANARV
jgi:hypothetical protein